MEIVLNIFFWLFFTWLYVFSNATMDAVGFEIIEGKQEKILVRNQLRLYTFLTLQAVAILFIYIELYFIHRLKKPKAVSVFVLTSILLFLVWLLTQASVFYLFYKYNGQLSELKDSNNFNSTIIISIFYFGIAVCYGFTKKWFVYEKDKRQLELVKNQAELNLLRQQLQPHFLFNTLNNIMAMVNQNDNPLLARSIDKLSGLLRYVVYDTKNEKVTIAKEIEFIQNFAELHTLRFEEDEVNFNLNVIGNYDTQVIEPGILLCYIENAFKHGLQPEEKAFIHIDIDISSPDKVTFEIENSVPKIRLTKRDGGYGIASNQERLDLAYPNKHKITFIKGNTYKVKLILQTND